MLEKLRRLASLVVPKAALPFLVSSYHRALAYGAMYLYGLPARKLYVIGVTGTKGKSTTVEMVNAILEEAGYRTAVISTIRFKIDTESRPNLFKMTMPGRGYIQKLLRDAVRADCTHVVVEITSEGARQFRHIGLMMNALIFTNIAPEHIESHGSYENYKRAKFSIGHALVASPKRPRVVIANMDDELGREFLKLPADRAFGFKLDDTKPFSLSDRKVSMTFGSSSFGIPLPGEFTILNAYAAALVAKEIGVHEDTIAHALGKLERIPGRLENIDLGQGFLALVDYAHTPDSLKALYGAFPNRRLICVLGNTGGGRDTWKRPKMGAVADAMCSSVILTNEDPYDEDPEAIVSMMAQGMARKPIIIMDRRKAISKALEIALSLSKGSLPVAVLITGKGTDPFIMGQKGTKIPWSDANVVRDELSKLQSQKVRGVE